MMKKMKKLALALVCAMLVCVLGGCAMSFDAAAYTKALLDNSYKNDPTAFVDMKIGTAEEAAALYEQGLDAEMAAIVTGSGMELTEEQEVVYRELFADILAGVKYTVGEAEKQEDNSYVVTVTYEQLNVFGPAMEAYVARITALTEEWMTAALTGGTTPSEDEMMDAIIMELATCLENSLAAATYDEPATTTIRIELNDRVYAPNQDDLANLEMVLFDLDAMEEFE